MKKVVIVCLYTFLIIFSLQCTQLPQKVIGSDGAGIGLIKFSYGNQKNVFLVGEGKNKYSWKILQDQLNELNLGNSNLSLTRVNSNFGVDIYVPNTNLLIQNSNDLARIKINSSDTKIMEEIIWSKSKLNVSMRLVLENIINFDKQDSTIIGIESQLALEHEADSLFVLGQQVINPRGKLYYLIAAFKFGDHYYYFSYQKNERMNDLNLAWFATMLQNVIIHDEYVLLNSNLEEWRTFKLHNWFY